MDRGTPATASATPLVDYDALCQRLRAALEPARAHAISLLDERGDVLWLSEGALGPDEHNVVLEAVEAFAAAGAAPVLVFDLGDSRCAVMVRTIDSRCTMVGIVMLVMDSRAIARGANKLMTPRLQRALLQFAETRRSAALAQGAARATTWSTAPASPPTVTEDGTIELSLVPTGSYPRPPDVPARAAQDAPAARDLPTSRAARDLPASRAAREVHATPGARDLPTPRAAREVAAPRSARAAPPRITLPPTLSPGHAARLKGVQKKATAHAIDRLHAALHDGPVALHVQRLMPLSKGGRLKRYEVLLRSTMQNAQKAAPRAMLEAAVDDGLGSMIDRHVVTELIGWLVRHPAVWRNNEAMFSVNLTRTALHDEHFMKFVESCLAKSSLPKGCIAFEIDAAAALMLADRISEVAATLHRLGCPLVLDDFALRTECIALLRLPGVRYVKLAPDVTAKMRTDKISQAAITAMVQMARVLGLHTVAKHTETAQEREWLTALGVDFVQSNALSPPMVIESLQRASSSR